MRNLLFFLVITLFSSCDQEIYSPSEIDFESNSLPEATVKKLNALLEDENGFLALNEIKLISFEISKSQNLPDLQIRKVILTRQNYLTREKENFNTKAANIYDFNFAKKEKNNSENNNIEKLIRKEILKHAGYQSVKLNWLIKGEKYSTNAFFSKENLIYDDILSNYTILIDKSAPSKKNRFDTKSDSKSHYLCEAQQTGHPADIGLTRDLWYSQQDPWGDTIGEARAKIKFFGVQNPSDCTKYLNTYSKTEDATGTSRCAATAKVHIIRFKGYSPYTGPGYCEYALGIALQLKSPWETITLGISYQGSSLKVSSTSNMTPTTFHTDGAYINAENLN